MELNTHTSAEARAQPELWTARLLLRPFTLADAPAVQRLAGDPQVSATALDLLYPFEDGMAEAWIETHAERFAAGTLAAFAVTSQDSAELYGAAGLMIEPAQRRAELGYWLGKAFWGQGYATEAAGAVIRYGFEQLALHRIHANHLVRNPGSGRVLACATKAACASTPGTGMPSRTWPSMRSLRRRPSSALGADILRRRTD